MIIGVDPGKTGGFVVAGQGHGPPVIVKVQKFKGMETSEMGFALYSAICQYKPEVVCIEKVHASPRMGVASAFTFGQCYETLCTAARISGTKTLHKSPQEWMALIGCMSKGDKGKMYDYARTILWPLYQHMFNKELGDAAALAMYTLKWAKHNGGT